MKYYDPILIGWGIDYLFIWANGQNKKKKFALIDYISCINPHDKDKKNEKRENENVDNFKFERNYWILLKKKLKINEPKHHVYSIVKNN